MYEVGGNVLLVPLGNLLDDDLCLVNPTCGEQPPRGLRHYPPTPQNMYNIEKAIKKSLTYLLKVSAAFQYT
jgi:hypothetical protein